MAQRLVVVEGPDKGRTFEFTGDDHLVIGRGQASDTQINDPRMSRVHCEVKVADGKATVHDSDSAAGTYVNGKRVSEAELVPGALVRAGETTLRFESGDVADQPTVMNEQLSPPKKGNSGSLAELVGKKVGPYQIESIISKGSSGMVFKARDTEKDRSAAVKVLTPQFTSSDEQRQRFVRAMQTMLPIKDPHLVQLYNAGKTGPYCWAAMEFVDGESLTAVIDRIGIEGMLGWEEVWRVAVHVGRALRQAYEHHIIHRNVTPTNIMRRTKDRACLLGDLMLAKALDGTMAQQITQPGQLIGDLPYMSPERTRDQAAVDCRSDIYGLGATCYALLTGKPPVSGDTLPAMIKNVRSTEPVPPRKFQLAINELFQAVVLRMIAKDPSDRYQTPNELLAELERIGRFNNLTADWSNWQG